MKNCYLIIKYEVQWSHDTDPITYTTSTHFREKTNRFEINREHFEDLIFGREDMRSVSFNIDDLDSIEWLAEDGRPGDYYSNNGIFAVIVANKY